MVIDLKVLILDQIVPAMWDAFSKLGPIALGIALGPFVLKHGWALFTSTVDRIMDAGAITGASESSREYAARERREARAESAARLREREDAQLEAMRARLERKNR